MTKIRLDGKNDFEEFLRMYCMPTRNIENDYKTIVEKINGDDGND